MTTTRSDLGRAGEDAAAAFLTARGWRVLARNVRRREGEVDIVARRDQTLAFVEVKTRSSSRFGSPGEAVTVRKQRRIRMLAATLLGEGLDHAREIRFDVIEVVRSAGALTLRHIEGAF